MINELYIQKLINLIHNNIITINDIKNAEYKIEVETRLASEEN